MLQLVRTKDVRQIQAYIRSHKQGKGPKVVAAIAGRVGVQEIYDVREEPHPMGPSPSQQERRQLQGLRPLPANAAQLEVRVDPYGRLPWLVAGQLYFSTEEIGHEPDTEA